MRRNTAWAALLVALALTAAGCAHSLSDDQIATNVKARMLSDAQLKGTSLSVVVKSGVATLSGQVRSVSERYEAFKLATETTGVKRVNDDMTIELPPMGTQAAANTPPPEPAPEPKPRHVSRHTRPAPVEPAPAPDENAPSQPPTQNAPVPPDNASPAPAPELPPPPSVQPVTVPDGTQVTVRMIDSIDSSQNHTGDIFHAELANPILVNHQVVVPRNTNVYLRLVEARSAGHLSGQSELRVELYRIELRGKSYPVVSNDYVVKGAKRAKRSALAIIGGAAVGAAIGAIAGGGKGAAIGAAAGGGGGAVYSEATKGQQVQIPSEALLNFKLQQPVDVTPSAPTPDQSGPNQNPRP
ncbi:MAG: BON domain-containing protein [Acidobacteriota bacterium]|nr:BON domain-containing protein [Acidobacteriota bacterium]